VEPDRREEIHAAVRAKARVLRRRVEQGSLWLSVEGESMGPTLGGDSEVLLVGAVRPRRGEIWAFYSDTGDLVVHRCLRVTSTAAVFQGDRHRRIDTIDDDLLVGRAAAVRRDGRTRPLGRGNRLRGWTLRTRRALKARLVG